MRKKVSKEQKSQVTISTVVVHYLRQGDISSFFLIVYTICEIVDKHWTFYCLLITWKFYYPQSLPPLKNYRENAQLISQIFYITILLYIYIYIYMHLDLKLTATGCSLNIVFFQEFSQVCPLSLSSTRLLLVVQKITSQ